MGESAVCVEIVAALGCSKMLNIASIDSGCEVKEESCSPVDGIGAEVFPGQKQPTEALNDDIKSEVLNPTISPGGNASSCHDITSQPTQVSSGEATSQCSGDLSQAETVSDDVEMSSEKVLTCSDAAQSHVSTTGIRKITFKFSKRKEDYENQAVSQLMQPAYDKESGRSYSELNDSGIGGFNSSDRYTHISHVGSMMSTNDVPSNYPSNVKKLLLTGILDGARVKYISRAQKRELDGFIHMGGYLCGCSFCNFSRVLSAYEFEQHADAKTKHPNNHIFLENGKPVYSIIQELKTVPLNLLDEVIKNVAGSAINEDLFQVWKASLQSTNATCSTDKRRCSHLLVSQSGNYLEESVCPSSAPLGYQNPIEWEKYMDSCERQHSTLKRPSLYDCSSGMKQKKSSDHCSKRSRRDNDLHRLLFMPNGLPNGAELAYYAKGQKLLSGYKQGNGIFCSCCQMEVSPSQFEAHAGMAARRQPYRHIYTSNGLTLHDIAVSLLNGQDITTGISDDMCTKCGSGGDLVFCTTCPRAFHRACLDSPDVSNGGWHCPECSQHVHEGNPSRSIVIRSTRVVKAPEYEVGGCAVCRSHDFTPVVFDDQTVILCDQCEKEFHVGCLRNSGICDLKEIPTNKWFCCDECKRIHAALETVVSGGLQMVPSSQTNIIISKHAEKGVFIDRGAKFQLHILKGSSHHPENLSLLSATTAIFRECFDPIVAATGRDLIPVMVHGRNISGQEFGGMYCILLTVNGVVVSAGLLRIFGRDIAELPLVATSREHQGKGYFQALFASIEDLLCSLAVQNLVLPAAEEAESIWTRRFGFRKINEQRMLEYSKYQLTIFNGTSMLEKEVQRTCQKPALADEV